MQRMVLVSMIAMNICLQLESELLRFDYFYSRYKTRKVLIIHTVMINCLSHFYQWFTLCKDSNGSWCSKWLLPGGVQSMGRRQIKAEHSSSLLHATSLCDASQLLQAHKISQRTSNMFWNHTWQSAQMASGCSGMESHMAECSNGIWIVA